MAFNNSSHHKAPERKSRRTHKNSRDGCPNCKAKRIKCTEELPACHNCIKKNYRCGYMDFPEERLEHIRRKNEKKTLEQQHKQQQLLKDSMQRLQTNDVSYNDQQLPTSDQPYGLYTPQQSNYLLNGSYYPNSFPRQSIQHQTQHNHQNFTHLVPQLEPEYLTTKDNLRSAVYRDSFLKLSSSPSVETGPSTDNCVPVPENYDYMNFENAQINYHRHINANSINFYNPQEIFHMNYPLNNDSLYDNSVLTNSSSDSTSISVVGSEKSTINYSPLPNAINEVYRFPKLKRMDRLKNIFLIKYLRYYKSNFKGLNNSEFLVRYSPVWTYKTSENFWTTVYNQATVLHVYFSFFMDRSLNSLLKTCNDALGSESLSNSSLETNFSDPTRQASTPVSISESPFFEHKDLDVLTRKSYTYYGDLIRDLRESLSEIHIEYPAKISLFAAWTTYLQLHATVDTVCLMNTGTTSLFLKIVNDAKSTDDITPTIKTVLNIFNDHSVSSIIPDYKFNVFYEIYEDLKNFKNFITDNKELTSKNNALTIRNLLELESFLHNLINDFHPKIVYINNYYKLLNNVKDNTSNIYFTSYTLFFELLVSWFKIFPSEAFSVGAKVGPLKKTFYLFFSAVGKTLINTFTPIRSMMLIDTCNVFCPRIDFNAEIFKFGKFGLSDFQFNYMNNLSTKLLRIIKFFDYRISFYAFHLSTTTVLNEEYLKHMGSISNKTKYKDIISLLPKKLELREVMVESFSKENIISFQNYPNFKLFEENNEFISLIHNEILNQQPRMNNISNDFDFKFGLFKSDFDPTITLSKFEQFQKNIWESNELNIDEVRLRTLNFDLGRKEISKGIQSSK